MYIHELECCKIILFFTCAVHERARVSNKKNAVHYQTVHVPNHLRLGSTLATSPLLTLVWNGAGRSTFP